MPFFPDKYVSKVTLLTKDGLNRDLVFQSGAAVFELKGTGQAWQGHQLLILTDAVWTGLPAVQASASLASISDDHDVVDAGWGVGQIQVNTFNNRILLQVNLAVRDIDAWIHRVAYQTTAVGTLAK